MTFLKMVAWMSMAGLGVVILSSGLTWNGHQGAFELRSAEAQVKVARYRSPRRNPRRRRIGGGTRGPGDPMPTLSVLAPSHTGLTLHAQPMLYWYVSKATTYPVEVNLIEAQGRIAPLFEIRLSPPVPAGVHRIRLADYGVHLAPGVRYQWSVALIRDLRSRSRDLVAGGSIERIGLVDALQARLTQAGKADKTWIYADAGIWYDAVSTLSALIDAAPQETQLREQRAALLEQVGLAAAAAYDTHHP